MNQIDQQPAVTETIAETIGAGESYIYTFETKADLSESGSYTIKAWSNLENDDIADNDTSTVSVRHFDPAKVPYFNGFEDAYSREAIKYFDLDFDEADGGNGCWAIEANSWFSSFSRTGDYAMIYWYSSNNVGDENLENNTLEVEFTVVKNPVMYYDFETGTVPEELTLRAEDGATVNSSLNDIFPNNEPWNVIEINEHPTFGSWMLTAASWFTTVVPADRWCISPQIGVTSDNADMVWSAMSGDAGENFAEDYEIMVSTTDAEPESFTSILTVTDKDFATNPSTRRVDLGAYKGQNIYVAIRLTTTDGYMLSIDNIGFYGDIVKGGSSVESVAADGRLWVSAGQVVCSAEQVDRIVVFDASGRQVAGCENQSTLDVDHLSSGVYLVRAMADGQVLQTKFIK